MTTVQSQGKSFAARYLVPMLPGISEDLFRVKSINSYQRCFKFKFKGAMKVKDIK